MISGKNPFENGAEDAIGFASEDSYQTDPSQRSRIASLFPTANFYRRFVTQVYRSSQLARRGQYDNVAWARSSLRVLRILESVGVQMQCCGLRNVRQLDGPAVFIGNHMSMFETMVLPAIIQPIRDLTFVVKQSLLDYPLFGHVMRSRNPIAVNRVSPRDDFKTMMTGGMDRLHNGISVVVFPQTTRSVHFDPEQFNSIGVKLAQRAGVPVVPIALKTDAWGNGKRLKDLGPIDPSKRVQIEFGTPLTIESRGGEEHRQIIEFISDRLAEWSRQEQELIDG